MDELVGLGDGGVEDLLVVVPGVGDADAGEAVDVLGAVGVVEEGAVAVVRDHRLDALHEPRHHVVAVLFLHTHAIDSLFTWTFGPGCGDRERSPAARAPKDAARGA